jgi:two-component sensor histidine kinase/PAS domain-containing protein
MGEEVQLARHAVSARDNSNSLTEAMIVTIRQPLLVLDEDLRIAKANPAFLRTFQVRSEDTVGRLIYDLGNRQWHIPALRKLLEKVIPENGYVEDYKVEHDFPSIDRKVMLLNACRIKGESERSHLILVAISDITELEKARYELEGQKEYSEKLIDSLRQALLVLDGGLRVKHANQPFYEIFQVNPAETEGRLVYELGNHQWDIPKLRILLEEILPEEQAFDDFEVQHDFDDIGNRTMLLNARRLDHLNLILLAIEDITERKHAQERQQMLTSELSHRVKNVITLIDSMATQTLTSSGSLDEFGSAFRGRLRAVARAHGELFSNQWRAADMRGLALATLEGCGSDTSRVELNGEALSLSPYQAMAVNLTLHELCTNAIKYGALSGEAGRVVITWSMQNRPGNREVWLLWKEECGPPVEQPQHKGYGMQLIETLVPYELHGEVNLYFKEDGVTCELRFPLNSLTSAMRGL